ncbi:MAG: DnaJ domain-containing protein [Legionellaceae bacterium]|nr:DnaJ domain-containing protein [Legionellaceae bacterium]
MLQFEYFSLNELKLQFGNQCETDWMAPFIYEEIDYRLSKYLIGVFKNFEIESSIGVGFAFNAPFGGGHLILNSILRTYAIELALQQLPEEKKEQFIREKLTNQEYQEDLRLLPSHERVTGIFEDIIAENAGQDIDLLSHEDNQTTQFDTNFSGKLAFLKWYMHKSTQSAPCDEIKFALEQYRNQLNSFYDPVLCRVLDCMLSLYRRERAGYFKSFKSLPEYVTQKENNFYYTLNRKIFDISVHNWFDFYQSSLDMKYFGLADITLKINSVHPNDIERIFNKWYENNSIYEALNFCNIDTILIGKKNFTKEQLFGPEKISLTSDEKKNLLSNIFALYSKLTTADFLTRKLLQLAKTNNPDISVHNSEDAFNLMGIPSYYTERMFVYHWDSLQNKFKSDITKLDKIEDNERAKKELIHQFQKQYIAYRYLYEHHVFPQSITNANDTQKTLNAALALFGFSPNEWMALNEGNINHQYRKLALKYHPDRDPSPKANDRFHSFTNARDFLLQAKRDTMTLDLTPHTQQETKVDQTLAITELEEQSGMQPTKPTAESQLVTNNTSLVLHSLPIPLQQKDNINKEIQNKTLRLAACNSYLKKRWLSTWLISHGLGGSVWLFSPLRYVKVSETLAFKKLLNHQEPVTEPQVNTFINNVYGHVMLRKEKAIESQLKHKQLNILKTQYQGLSWSFNNMSTTPRQRKDAAQKDGEFYESFKTDIDKRSNP